MATNPRVLVLLKVLAEATLQEKLEWADGNNRDSFLIEMDYGAIKIEEEDGTSSFHYIITLRDSRDIVLDQWIFTEFDKEEYGLAKKVYELAGRNARRIDGLLDRMIADLKRELESPAGPASGTIPGR